MLTHAAAIYYSFWRSERLTDIGMHRTRSYYLLCIVVKILTMFAVYRTHNAARRNFTRLCVRKAVGL